MLLVLVGSLITPLETWVDNITDYHLVRYTFPTRHDTRIDTHNLFDRLNAGLARHLMQILDEKAVHVR